MENRRLKWRTVDDQNSKYNALNIDFELDNNYQAQLEPQRIRTFRVTYSKVSQDKLKQPKMSSE